MSAKHTDVMTAAVTRLQGLSLTGIASGNIRVALLAVVDKLIKKEALRLPAIIVSPTLSETINKRFTGDNVADFYGWPYTVAIVTNADSPELIDNLDKYLTWRFTIMQAFHNKHLLTPDQGDLLTEIQPSNIIEQNAWVDSNLFVSGFTFRTYTREVR